MSQVFQIEKLVDDQKLGAFNLKLLLWSFLAMFGDGFDISALASAAPELRRVWGVAPQDFSIALSASQFGVLFGAPLLGYFGDRYGRRIAIITGCVIFGFGTLATVWASDLSHMTVLRFITGIGIGGLMPNAIALNSELSPRRWRATLVVLMFTGITAGSGMPGNIQAWLIPTYGWQIMFWIGGLVPLAIAALLWFTLPESVKFLALQPRRRAELLATVRRMRPDLQIADDAQFVSAPGAAWRRGSGLAQLFGPGLRFITPLLWLCFATALMANFFLNSWLPLIFENNGLTPQEAGVATSMYHYGGTDRRRAREPAARALRLQRHRVAVPVRGARDRRDGRAGNFLRDDGDVHDARRILRARRAVRQQRDLRPDLSHGVPFARRRAGRSASAASAPSWVRCSAACWSRWRCRWTSCS